MNSYKKRILIGLMGICCVYNASLHAVTMPSDQEFFAWVGRIELAMYVTRSAWKHVVHPVYTALKEKCLRIVNYNEDFQKIDAIRADLDLPHIWNWRKLNTYQDNAFWPYATMLFNPLSYDLVQEKLRDDAPARRIHTIDSKKEVIVLSEITQAALHPHIERELRLLHEYIEQLNTQYLTIKVNGQQADFMNLLIERAKQVPDVGMHVHALRDIHYIDTNPAFRPALVGPGSLSDLLIRQHFTGRIQAFAAEQVARAMQLYGRLCVLQQTLFRSAPGARLVPTDAQQRLAELDVILNGPGPGGVLSAVDRARALAVLHQAQYSLGFR